MFRLPEVSGVGSTGEAGIPEIKDTDMLAAGEAGGAVCLGVGSLLGKVGWGLGEW